jgi:hypothetical protein
VFQKGKGCGLEKGRYFYRRKAITSVMFLPVRG